MSKIIYKYPIFGYNPVIRVPYRAQVLSIDYDPNYDLCMWIIHDLSDETGREVEYEVLVLPTGFATDKPLNVLNDAPEQGYDYVKTIVIKEHSGYVWHIFMRENYFENIRED